MKSRSKSDRHLRVRGGHWHYYRRVPTKYQGVDPRGTIRLALGTTSLETARLRRDELARADDEFWAVLLLAAAASAEGQRVDPRVAEHRYRAACAAAMAAGFAYRPMERLVQPGNIEDMVERLLSLKANRIGTTDLYQTAINRTHWDSQPDRLLMRLVARRTSPWERLLDCGRIIRGPIFGRPRRDRVMGARYDVFWRWQRSMTVPLGAMLLFDQILDRRLEPGIDFGRRLEGLVVDRPPGHVEPAAQLRNRHLEPFR